MGEPGSDLRLGEKVAQPGIVARVSNPKTNIRVPTFISAAGSYEVAKWDGVLDADAWGGLMGWQSEGCTRCWYDFGIVDGDGLIAKRDRRLNLVTMDKGWPEGSAPLWTPR